MLKYGNWKNNTGFKKKKRFVTGRTCGKIDVSRQAVSKWENGSSVPDVEKIIALSDFFQVSTDYMLKGKETEKNIKENFAKIFTVAATAVNFIGIVLAVIIWNEYQTTISVAVGVILMAVGCMFFAFGMISGNDKNKLKSAKIFFAVNIWFLIIIPIAFVFNFLSGIIGGYYPFISPLPQLGNSIAAYIFCYVFYIGICVCADIFILKKK